MHKCFSIEAPLIVPFDIQQELQYRWIALSDCCSNYHLRQPQFNRGQFERLPNLKRLGDTSLYLRNVLGIFVLRMYNVDVTTNEFLSALKSYCRTIKGNFWIVLQIELDFNLS